MNPSDFQKMKDKILQKNAAAIVDQYSKS